MGLDTTHDAWHGAYSSFSRWRDTLTKAAELPMAAPTSAYDLRGEVVDADWDSVNNDNIMGEWGEKRPTLSDGTYDPLLFLLCHSDCEGLLHPYHSGLIADRLEELLPKVEGIDGGGHIGNMGDKTRRFIAGLRLAVERGEDVEFW